MRRLGALLYGPAYIAGLSLIRFGLTPATARTGGLVNADYLVVLLLFRLTQQAGARRAVTISAVLASSILAVSADMAWTFSRIFRWSPGALADYMESVRDWPWSLLVYDGALVLLIATLSILPLVSLGRRRLPLWPAIAFIALLWGGDTLNGQSQFSRQDKLVSLNLVTSATRELLGPVLLHKRTDFPPAMVQGQTMWRLLSAAPNPPAQILSIGVESLGWAKDDNVRRALERAIAVTSGTRYALSYVGAHRAVGGTLAGELRELCGARILSVPTADRQRALLPACLPRKLASLGYGSAAFHGNGGGFYRRETVYPLLGFRRQRFFEDLVAMGAQTCPDTLFSGVCDAEVFKTALMQFDGARRFVHVMTLDTHLPIAGSSRLCAPEFEGDPRLCRYGAAMQRTLMSLGRALASAQHAPDVVFVYGDHAPPFMNSISRAKFSEDWVPFWILRRVGPEMLDPAVRATRTRR